MEPGEKPRDRSIRVFISSTFLDMKAERDYLVKFIFPQLRKLCEHRGVVWGEVDLRWGVTDEQKAEGRVLPICLEEINRCRPYFIGLLGQRYGWIPDAIPQEVINREPWLQEHLHGRKSVTELEILHGVLNKPEMAEHAFFYFRDAAYVDSVPPEKRKEFVAEDADGARKLEELKDRIRMSGFPVKENYTDPKALGELVLKDLTDVIDELFPEGSQPDPLDREAMDHEAHAQSRAKVYIGRQEYFDRLDAHAAASDDQPLVVLGESGGGKSALLANWAARYRQTHSNVLVIQHYTGATPYSADWSAMLRRIMGEFKRKLGLQQDIPDSPDALRSAFANWLHMAAAKGRVVLILDALNQLEDRDGAPDLVWLPPVMPADVRLIVSTLPGRSLEEIQKRRWPTMKVEPLDAEERRKLIVTYLAQSAKALGHRMVERIAFAPQSANPLYLRVLLDELRLFGEHQQLGERIEQCLQAQSPCELYGKVIARWDEDYGEGTALVADSLSLLWASRRGLSESELLEAMGSGGQPILRAAWSPLFLAMSEALVSRGGLLTFAHDFLREAARDAYVPTQELQHKAHLLLADYFEPRPAGPRRIDELPWQLAQAGAWERLYRLLAERVFFIEAWDRDEFDVKTYWTQIEAASALRMVDAYRLQIERPEIEADKHFLNSLSMLLSDTGHPDESLGLRSTLVEHFRAAGDSSNLQACLGNQALILKARGDLDGAMALHKQEEQIARDLGDRISLARCLGNQALILKTRSDLDGAMGLLKLQEQISRELGNKNLLAACLGNQAVIMIGRGNLDEAMALLKRQEQVCLELGSKDLLATCLGNQSNVFFARGDLDGAMARLMQQEQMCRDMGNKDGLQRALGNQATIILTRGFLDGAMRLFKQQEQICRELGSKDNLAVCLGNQAAILISKRDFDAGMVLLKQQEQIGRELGNKDALQLSLGNQAAILQQRGDLHEALALYKQVELICREVGYAEDLVRCLANQTLVLHNMGRSREGKALVREAYSMAVSRGYATLARQIETILNALG